MCCRKQNYQLNRLRNDHIEALCKKSVPIVETKIHESMGPSTLCLEDTTGYNLMSMYVLVVSKDIMIKKISYVLVFYSIDSLSVQEAAQPL
jgi:hypothetical protein